MKQYIVDSILIPLHIADGIINIESVNYTSWEDVLRIELAYHSYDITYHTDRTTVWQRQSEWQYDSSPQ